MNRWEPNLHSSALTHLSTCLTEARALAKRIRTREIRGQVQSALHEAESHVWRDVARTHAVSGLIEARRALAFYTRDIDLFELSEAAKLSARLKDVLEALNHCTTAGQQAA